MQYLCLNQQEKGEYMDKIKEVKDFNNDKKMSRANSINFNFSDNKSTAYAMLFYSFGLFIGAFFYKIAQSDSLNKLIAIQNDDIKELLIRNFCIYLTIFLLTAFFGFCLIGKPIAYIVPVFVGIGIGCKLGYYFINFNTKGIGYSLIMIVPYIALFMSILSYTISTTSDLSTSLIKLAKGEGSNHIELPPYYKKYLIYFVMIIAVAVLDSVLTKLLATIVTI